MTLFRGDDRHQTPQQKLAQVERSIERLAKAQQGRETKLMRSLRASKATLETQIRLRKKGVLLTKQAYR